MFNDDFFKGWPPTEVNPEKEEIQIVARYLSPRMYDWNWRVGRLIAVFMVIYFLFGNPQFWSYTGSRPPLGHFFQVLIGKMLPWVGGWILFYKFVLPYLWMREVRIIFRGYYIKIKSCWIWARKLTRWKNFEVFRDYEFRVEPLQTRELGYSFYFISESGIVNFSPIGGEDYSLKANNLKLRLHTIKQKYIGWFNEILRSPERHWKGKTHFNDINRKEWPMAESQKLIWPLWEGVWWVFSFVVGALALNAIMVIVMRGMGEAGFFWYLYSPVDEGHNSLELWYSFFGGSILVLLIMMTLNFYHLFYVWRFLKIERGILWGHPKRWELEEGGFCRLIIGFISWGLTFVVSFFFFYKYSPELLSEIFGYCRGGHFWVCRWIFIFDYEIYFGGLLGFLGGVVLLYFADLVKLVIDFPFQWKFPKRELGLQDLMFLTFETALEEV